MAIDSNVLINERIREELRNGMTPAAAITAGYERAFGTILDSNVTTLIAGIALLIFGSGPVRGFAVVHCLGIMTSLFSSVVVSRSLVNLIYGGRRRVASLSIGQVWKPPTAGASAAGSVSATVPLAKPAAPVAGKAPVKAAAATPAAASKPTKHASGAINWAAGGRSALGKPDSGGKAK
jgi:uncharacterized membrane protein YdfJ with MMPL/SSD domain